MVKAPNMSEQTIQVGIDLGTTNSSAAVNVDGSIEIIKKPGGVGYTPSVFGFNRSLNKVVGQKAYEHLYKYGSKNEVANFKSEIKRLMGIPETIFFERTNVSMSPEEISSEILKSLKEDILRKYPDFNTVAAVITIPAAFSVLQSEATKKAGNLAGFKHVVLLQEPIAAASSYGFQNSDNANWLVYDLGGGTFDIALISSKDGILSVLGHSGDNFLGGKNVDWDIVDTVIVPRMLERYSLTDFTRKNPRHQNVFSNLKYHAEHAKIELSQYEKTTIDIENVGDDDEGDEMVMSIELSRHELEDIIRPTIDHTIELARATLKEAGVKHSSIEKIILVGGPTQMPYVKARLESELKIKTDSSIDPLTVVAHGACVFGMSKQIPKNCLPDKPAEVGAHNITLNHSQMTSETEESVTGIIDGLDEHEQFYIQIQSERGTFSGPKTKINRGKFYYPVTVEPNMQNKFWVYVFDEDGNTVKVSTDSFTITHGLTVSGVPIPHSIRVVAATKDHQSNRMRDVCDTVFEKGSILPQKTILCDYKTSKTLMKDEDSTLDIRIVEGESEIPDRNDFVCETGIHGSDIPCAIPAGTPIELTIEYDESRNVSVTAYIPMIDVRCNARTTIKDETIDVEEISREFEVQRNRMNDITEHCSVGEREKAESVANSVERGISNSDADEDEKRRSSKQLKNLKIMLDDIEGEKTMSKLESEYNSKIENLRVVIDRYADPDRRAEIESRFDGLKSDGQRAIDTESKDMLTRTNEQIDALENMVLFSNLDFCIYQFERIVELGGDKGFTNEGDARYYTTKGSTAIKEKDIDELNRCIHELIKLLPRNERADFHAGIMR